MGEMRDVLLRIEEIHHVKIIYAVEMGSRIWGWNSPSSDYDVRFVYVRPFNRYFYVNEPDDTITAEDGLDSTLADLHGWDFRKFTRLLVNSNPSAIEWLCSPVIYHTTWSMETISSSLPVIWSPLVLYHHYYNMAKKHMEKYLHAGDTMVDFRKYLHILRPMLVVALMHEREAIPPLSIQDLMEAERTPAAVRDAVLQFIEARRASNAIVLPRNDAIEEYCHHLMSTFNQPSGRILHAKNRRIDQDIVEALGEIVAETVAENSQLFSSLARVIPHPPQVQ